MKPLSHKKCYLIIYGLGTSLRLMAATQPENHIASNLYYDLPYRNAHGYKRRLDALRVLWYDTLSEYVASYTTYPN